MSFITPKTLRYEDHEEELACLAAVMSALARNEVAEAMRLINERRDALQAAPQVVDYDIREEQRKCS